MDKSNPQFLSGKDGGREEKEERGRELERGRRNLEEGEKENFFCLLLEA